MRPSQGPGQIAPVRYAQEHRDTIRRIISSRLGSRLRHVYSTADIEQSLLLALMEQHSRPLAEIEARRLVTVIALRLIWAKARNEHHSRWEVPPPSQEIEAGSIIDPSEQAATRELMDAARALAGADWSLVEARLEGRTFPELATTFGESADALRMRFRRALDQITEQLGGPGDE
jgi:hypothetical protein